MGHLGPIDWAIFAGYLLIIFGIALCCAPRQHDNEDYFVGGRRMNWMAVGLSLFASAFSSISFVAYPREAAYETFQFFVAILFIPLVITPLLWWWFVPFFLRQGGVSAYAYLEQRFHPSLRKLGTLLFAGYALGWMGTMLYAVGLIVQAVLRLDEAGLIWTLVATGLFATFYTSLGGVRAVIWTDVLQALVLGGGAVAVFVMAVQQVDGGLAAVLQIGSEHGKFQMLNFDLDWTQRGTFWTACAFGLFMYLPGYTVSQVQVQRYLAMGSLREARRALLLNAVVVTLVILLFFFLGATLFAYCHQHGGLPNLPRDKQDQILPMFVATALPPIGLLGLLIAGLFAAAMSTLDSGINSLTALVVYDWLSGRHISVAVSRLLTAVFGLAVIAAALLVPALAPNVIGMITTVAGTFLGLLLGLFLLGMFSRAGTAAAWLGLAAGGGSVAVAVWLKVPHWYYGAFALFPTLLVGWLAGRLGASRSGPAPANR